MTPFKALTMLTLCAAPAFAGAQDEAMAEWMCLFERLPVELIAAQDDRLDFAVTNNTAFPVTAIAVDIQASIGATPERLETILTVEIDPALQPGDTAKLTGQAELTADQRALGLIDLNGSRAAVANVLDQAGRRLVVREDIGPSYKVIWAGADKSPLSCVE